MAMSVRRDGELVLDFPAVNAIPPRPGGQPRPTRLRSFKDAGGTLTLDYEGARTELRPGADSVAVTTWFYQPGPETLAALRWRIDPAGQWYGGAFQGLNDEHVLPLNQARFRVDSFVARGSTQGTPLWYTTKGAGVWLRTPQDFRYAVNQSTKGEPDGLIALEIPGVSSLSYQVLIQPNGREVVRYILREIGFPHATPPAEYMRLPIYTTWVENKGGLNQEKLLAFARKIRESNLPCGVIEIDMGWETKFGDLEVDLKKFPDMKAMTDELHRMGIRTTLWVANFVNVDSKPFAEHRNDGMLVNDLSGNVGLTGWWAGFGSVWDFTNPRAAAEYRRRLMRLQQLYGVDGFKFDSGEANLVPRDMRTFVPVTPQEYADYFNREAVAYFTWNESRVGVYSQPTGIVQRLQDKQSSWSNRNGLAAMISQVFTVSLRGFFYVMPDIVGGNEYGREPLDKELLVRWAQASALMPLIQFSKGPWHFDEEALRLVRDASRLHIEFAPYTFSLADQARSNGEPLVAPLWYHAPEDANTFSITDQFMLGPNVVVAPVVVKGAAVRDIYLPAGAWIDYKTKARLTGGAWLRAYPAPLDTLPVFLKDSFQVTPTIR
ncbi:MAG: glycoside hydrolase family 31 protein [Candidatus Solibacter sp.]|nr:glycoside hydrolase family 31 protein [Candidatus Solibacter sp.]